MELKDNLFVGDFTDRARCPATWQDVLRVLQSGDSVAWEAAARERVRDGNETITNADVVRIVRSLCPRGLP